MPTDYHHILLHIRHPSTSSAGGGALTWAFHTKISFDAITVVKLTQLIYISTKTFKSQHLNNNETGSRSPCMRPRSDPPNFGPIERGEKQTNNID